MDCFSALQENPAEERPAKKVPDATKLEVRIALVRDREADYVLKEEWSPSVCIDARDIPRQGLAGHTPGMATRIKTIPDHDFGGHLAQ
jgi:hypothetical protein